MDLALVVLLRHLRPLEADGLQRVHQVRQDLLRGLIRRLVLRLHRQEGPGIREDGGGVMNGAVRQVHGDDVIPGSLVQRRQQILPCIRRLEMVVEGIVRLKAPCQGIPGAVPVHAVLGVDPVEGPRPAVYEPPLTVLK